MKTEYLLDKQVKQVLQLLTPSNQLVMQVCLHTGIRVSDALALERKQLSRRFWITEQKTGKRKCIGLPDALIAAINKQAIAEGGKGTKWAFPGRNGDKPRTRQAVWKDVKRAAIACRIPQNIAPHSFRKVYAVKLLEAFGDIDKVMKALNHGNMAVTMMYCMAAQMMQQQTIAEPLVPGKRIRKKA